MNPKLEVKGNEFDSATSDLKQVIRVMADAENNGREKLPKRYTMSENEAHAYDQGVTDGYEAGRQKGFAEGWDAAMKEARKEEEGESSQNGST